MSLYASLVVLTRVPGDAQPANIATATRAAATIRLLHIVRPSFIVVRGRGPQTARLQHNARAANRLSEGFRRTCKTLTDRTAPAMGKRYDETDTTGRPPARPDFRRSVGAQPGAACDRLPARQIGLHVVREFRGTR